MGNIFELIDEQGIVGETDEILSGSLGVEFKVRLNMFTIEDVPELELF